MTWIRTLASDIRSIETNQCQMQLHENAFWQLQQRYVREDEWTGYSGRTGIENLVKVSQSCPTLLLLS